MNRKGLLTAALGIALATRPSPARAQAMSSPSTVSRDTATLVLPGGGTRGAYEAGAIEGLRVASGVSDGIPLPGVSTVAGTSIGAINGWFVATAQYSLLAQLWRTVSSDRVFQIKKQYTAVENPSSGIMTRLVEAAFLAKGLATNVTGLLDAARVQTWLARHIDPSVPVLMNYVFTLTNLSLQRSEVFYRTPVAPTVEQRTVGAQRVRSVFGETVALREVEDSHLIPALAGSSAIPILFDPVSIEFEDGVQSYIDGGIADSTPLALASAISRRLQLILVDPARGERQNFGNAAAVIAAAFSIAQNRVLEASLRTAYLETQVKKLFRQQASTREQQSFLKDTFDVELFVVRPQRELPVSLVAFDDGDGIGRAYELGHQAGLAGFREYDPDPALVS